MSRPFTTHSPMKKAILTSSLIAAATSSLFASSPDTSAKDSVLFIIPQESLADEAKVDKESTLGHFTWGADIGSSVDLTANDMTSVNLTGYFGYKNRWFRLLGVGAAIHTMLGNASRCYPVYAIARTSFSSQPQLCFLDIRGGVSFNNILNYPSQTDFYGSLGIGITLARGKKFSSHIIVSYSYMPTRPFTVQTKVPVTDSPGEVFEGDPVQTTVIESRMSYPDLHFASIRIGCAF